MSQPEGDGGDREHREVVDRPFLVAGGDATELLQAVNEPLHDIALPVGVLVEPDSSLTFLASNDHADPSSAEVAPDLLAAVALVTCDSIWANPWSSVSPPLDCPSFHQGLEHDLLVALARRQQQHHGLAIPLRPDVDLGPEAPLAPSQRLVGIAQAIDPLFCAPAAC